MKKQTKQLIWINKVYSANITSVLLTKDIISNHVNTFFNDLNISQWVLSLLIIKILSYVYYNAPLITKCIASRNAHFFISTGYTFNKYFRKNK